MTDVVLVALSTTAPGGSLVQGVETLRAAGARVHLVSRAAPDPALAAVLDEYINIGSPVAALHLPGRLRKIRVQPNRLRDAVALARGPKTRSVFESADALVAVDATALPAVWLAARRSPGVLALNGLPAAVTRLAGHR